VPIARAHSALPRVSLNAGGVTGKCQPEDHPTGDDASVSETRDALAVQQARSDLAGTLGNARADLPGRYRGLIRSLTGRCSHHLTSG
jgi:hypothetical protein